MITEWLVAIVNGIATWVGSMFPQLDLPEEVVNADDAFNNIMALGSGLGAFVDWSFVGIMAAIPITLWLGGLAIRALRVLVWK